MEYNELLARKSEMMDASSGDYENTPTPDEKNKRNYDYGYDDMEINFDQLVESAKLKPKLGSATGVANKMEVDAVIKSIIKTKGLPENEDSYNRVMASCASHCQQGATSPKYADSRTVVEYRISLKVSEMRVALKANGLTARKFARGIRSTIIKVAQMNEIEGNLSKNYKLENAGFDQQDLYWVE